MWKQQKTFEEQKIKEQLITSLTNFAQVTTTLTIK